jgi:hypothetical protein
LKLRVRGSLQFAVIYYYLLRLLLCLLVLNYIFNYETANLQLAVMFFIKNIVFVSPYWCFCGNSVFAYPIRIVSDTCICAG